MKYFTIIFLLLSSQISAKTWVIEFSNCYLENDKGKKRELFNKSQVMILQQGKLWKIVHLNDDTTEYPLNFLKEQDGIITLFQPIIGPGHRSYTIYNKLNDVIYTEVSWSILQSMASTSICFGRFK